MAELPSVKILLSYHKKDILFKDDILTPIQVGTSLFKESNNDSELEQWFSENMFRDDTGENISSKNKVFNEMTAIYWAWKNYDALGNPDYIGFEHYRRHFIFRESKQALFECNSYSPEYLSDMLGYSYDAIVFFLKKAEFIVAKPNYYTSVRDQYANTLDVEELDDAVAILKNIKPEYAGYCDEYVNGHASFFFNMFVMPREMFFEYCEFVFPILFEYERTHDLEGRRLYLSERLTGVFIYAKMQQKRKCQYLPVMYLEEEITIPMVFATDENYLEPTATAMVSVLLNSKPTTFCEFHLLIPEDLNRRARDLLTPAMERYPNCSLAFHDIRKLEFNISIEHTSVPTYYRLLLTEILPDCPKCLYLDSDIIVLSDLASLFRTNISAKYIAGVRAAGYYYPDYWKEEHSAEIEIPIEDYVNAGVLLMNLDLIRKDGVDERMLELATRGYSSQDQDVINIACHGRIRCLDPTYNMMVKYLRREKGVLNMVVEAARVYGLSDTAVKGLPKIIHYADKVKPWSGNCVYDGIWKIYNGRFKHLERRFKVSVILPVYNKQEYLAQCLDSILSQSIKDVEIVAIDDGSTDSSLSILREYASKDDRILLIERPNHGVGHARNTGIKNCSAPYFCFMDPDDYYPYEDILEKLYNAVTGSGLNIAGGSWSEDIAGEVKSVFVGKYSKYILDTEGVMEFKDYQFDYGFHRFIYSTSFIRSEGILFPEYIRYQDPPFFLKAMVAAERFYAIPDVVYRYRYERRNLDWDAKRTGDFILGIIDNLRLSSEKSLAVQHRITVDRINHEYSDRIVSCIRNTRDPKVMEYLIRANTAVDRALLKTIIPSMTENFCLRPLMEVINTPQPTVEKKKPLPYRAYRLVRHKVKKFFRNLK